MHRPEFMQRLGSKIPNLVSSADSISLRSPTARAARTSGMAALVTEAILRDRANSMAYASLAFARHFEALFGWGDGPIESHNRLGEAARKAVAADDRNPMAHTALAIFELFSGRHEEARRCLGRALKLNPNSEFARGYLGVSYAFGGDYDAALQHLEEAIRLSPRGLLVVIWHLCKGWAALLTGRYEEAIEFTELAREANRVFPDIYVVLASAYGHLGSNTASRSALDQLLYRMPGVTPSDERLVRPFARVADRERFLEGLRKAGLTSESNKVLEQPGTCGEDSHADQCRGRHRGRLVEGHQGRGRQTPVRGFPLNRRYSYPPPKAGEDGPRRGAFVHMKSAAPACVAAPGPVE